MAVKKTMSGPDAARAANAARKVAPAKIKVSQATIDEIKKMGMKNALSMVKMYAGQSRLKGKDAATTAAEGKKFLAGSTAEGVRRLYGDRRYGIATGATKPAAPKKTVKTSPKKFK